MNLTSIIKLVVLLIMLIIIALFVCYICYVIESEMVRRLKSWHDENIQGEKARLSWVMYNTYIIMYLKYDFPMILSGLKRGKEKCFRSYSHRLILR